MAQTTVTPNAMARTLSAKLHRTITAKAVRTVARDSIARFDKTKHPAYQGHEYSAAEQAALLRTFQTRGSRGRAEPAAPKAKAKATRAKASRKGGASPVAAPSPVVTEA